MIGQLLWCIFWYRTYQTYKTLLCAGLYIWWYYQAGYHFLFLVRLNACGPCCVYIFSYSQRSLAECLVHIRVWMATFTPYRNRTKHAIPVCEHTIRVLIFLQYIFCNMTGLVRKFANASKNCSENGKARILLHLTTQQNEFMVLCDTIISLEHKPLACTCGGAWGAIRNIEQLSLLHSLSLFFSLSFSPHTVSRANGQNAHKLAGVRDTALESQSCYSAILLITPPQKPLSSAADLRGG